MKYKILFCIIAFLVNSALFAQQKPEMVVVFLANDKISDVNINEEKFLASFGNINDLVTSSFATIPNTQKIAILYTIHTKGKPTIEFHSNPKIDASKQASFLKAMEVIAMENTKLVDFPLLITLNSNLDQMPNDFLDFTPPTEKAEKEYQNATIKEKYELLKTYAAGVLPILAAYEKDVEDKFAGVKGFGAMVAKTDFEKPQDIAALTSKNQDYWRATMEMAVGNQLIPITKIFILASQGQIDYAFKYIEILEMFSDPKMVSTSYLKELKSKIRTFEKELHAELEKGIIEHDKGNYEEAIVKYNSILASYPNSAWTKYELYYSQNALGLKNETIQADDRSDWDKAKIGIYKSNPLYNMDVRASNGKEAFLLFRRYSIAELFKDKKNTLEDVYKYADIAMDLEVYDFAAQLFWLSSTFDSNNKEALNRYLYCLEKLGVAKLKENFKGDFNKEFKRIEKEKEKEMKESQAYKALKS